MDWEQSYTLSKYCLKPTNLCYNSISDIIEIYFTINHSEKELIQKVLRQFNFSIQEPTQKFLPIPYYLINNTASFKTDTKYQSK